MIKDNHISVAGGIANAIRSVDQFLEKEKLTIPVEVLVSDVHVEKDIPVCICIHNFVDHFGLVSVPVYFVFFSYATCSHKKKKENHKSMPI